MVGGAEACITEIASSVQVFDMKMLTSTCNHMSRQVGKLPTNIGLGINIGPGINIGLGNKIGFGIKIGFGNNKGLGNNIGLGSNIGQGYEVSLGNKVGFGSNKALAVSNQHRSWQQQRSLQSWHCSLCF